ncbi:hypothetical protein ROHU_000383 [Labeo rohita]|uniref:Uncharacterized protein n=1 Tax=Labeo rohita TaxID=84645 RepID=A0A498P4S8_LABRO|nr:hypothetical protein ROHU_000383 [Labeo rohita]
MHRASSGGRAEELDDTGEAHGSREQGITNEGGIRKSGGSNESGRSPDRTGKEDEDSRVGTSVGTGSMDHRSIRFKSTSCSALDCAAYTLHDRDVIWLQSDLNNCLRLAGCEADAAVLKHPVQIPQLIPMLREEEKAQIGCVHASKLV